MDIYQGEEVDEFLANQHQEFTAGQLAFFREARRIYRERGFA